MWILCGCGIRNSEEDDTIDAVLVEIYSLVKKLSSGHDRFDIEYSLTTSEFRVDYAEIWCADNLPKLRLKAEAVVGTTTKRTWYLGWKKRETPIYKTIIDISGKGISECIVGYRDWYSYDPSKLRELRVVLREELSRKMEPMSLCDY